ncbi:MAG: hypothetical protein WD037_03295 [Balneolales bacterium]
MHLRSATGGTAGGRGTKIGTGGTPVPASFSFLYCSFDTASGMHSCILNAFLARRGRLAEQLWSF